MFIAHTRASLPGKWASPRGTSPAFSLIELVAVVAIIGILGGTITPLVFQNLTNKRGRITEAKLVEFKKSIAGNPFVVDKEVRASFGYVGDMGNMPGQLEDLYIRGAQPAYAYNTALKTGAGWRGPYLDPAILEDLATINLDGYGQEFSYSTTVFTDPQIGASVVGQITSLGPGRAAGEGDDLNIEVFLSEVFSEVTGFVKDMEGNRVPGATVRMNYPINGTLMQAVSVTDSNGFFSFSSIPYGNRSISLEPGLAYSMTSAKTYGDSNQNVELSITNFSSSDITVAAVKVYFNFDSRPEARYGDLFLAGASSLPAGRKQSGQRVWFTPAILIRGTQSIWGAGTPSGQRHPVRVQSPQTHLPDLRIESFPAGETVKLQILDFGSASEDLGVSGVPIEVEFYADTAATILISRIFFTPTQY
jgi:prepilin-type N-terminal cleavage/methylation domain-containing protein